MPTYDPTFRGSSSNLSTGGTSTVAVNTASAQTGDLFIVNGVVNGAIQINPPDGTWTRLNGTVSGYQSFAKIFSVGMNVTFSWNGTNQAYVFTEYAIFSAGGGTVSVDQLIASVAGSASSKTSDAVTPTQNALVVVDFIEFVDSGVVPPAGLTQILNSFGCWGGDIYLAAGVTSNTYTASSQLGVGNRFWGSGTYSLISSLVNPLNPPFVDDELAFTPAVNQTGFPPFVDDELAFTPSVGIGAMHTTTANAEVALQLSSAGTNLRITEASAEVASQVSLVGVAQLRATQVTAEIALQTKPPIGPVDFEIQTPSKEFGPGELGLTKRIYIDVNCAAAGLQQVLFPTLLADDLEIPLPAITNSQRGIIEIAWQQSGHLFGIRLNGRFIGGRVEVFRIDIDPSIGREPGI